MNSILENLGILENRLWLEWFEKRPQCDKKISVQIWWKFWTKTAIIDFQNQCLINVIYDIFKKENDELSKRKKNFAVETSHKQMSSMWRASSGTINLQVASAESKSLQTKIIMERTTWSLSANSLFQAHQVIHSSVVLLTMSPVSPLIKNNTNLRAGSPAQLRLSSARV